MGWIKPLMDIMMSGVSETVAYQVEQLFRLLRIQQTEKLHDSPEGRKYSQSLPRPENHERAHNRTNKWNGGLYILVDRSEVVEKEVSHHLEKNCGRKVHVTPVVMQHAEHAHLV